MRVLRSPWVISHVVVVVAAVGGGGSTVPVRTLATSRTEVS
jgi:hypothetical protein